MQGLETRKILSPLVVSFSTKVKLRACDMCHSGSTKKNETRKCKQQTLEGSKKKINLALKWGFLTKPQ